MKLTIECNELETQGLIYSLEHGAEHMTTNKREALAEGATEEADAYNSALLAIASLAEKVKKAIAENLENN